MFKKNDNIYKFNVGDRIINVEHLNGGVIEVYDVSDPSHTGFIIDELKHFISLINNMADVAEHLLEESKNETK